VIEGGKNGFIGIWASIEEEHSRGHVNGNFPSFLTGSGQRVGT
jgi:hypothetical protein